MPHREVHAACEQVPSTQSAEHIPLAHSVSSSHALASGCVPTSVAAQSSSSSVVQSASPASARRRDAHDAASAESYSVRPAAMEASLESATLD